MSKYSNSNFSTLNIVAPVILIFYLCIGFIPNWGAVDKIAPQWLAMSIINLISFGYFFNNRKAYSNYLTNNIKSNLTLTYICFILWAIGSLFYAINPTEVVVNLARQINVFIMFFSMVILINGLKDKLRFFSWVITILIIIENYAVMNEALDMINTNGFIKSGELKGVTANRNITAFSLAIKIPFVLFLIYLLRKIWGKIVLATLVCITLISLSMIQSRASFVAVGFITISYITIQIILYLKVNKKKTQFFKIGYIIAPLLVAVLFNQIFLSSKGADAISRASTISLSTNDGSVNQRIRYYQDVLTHMTSNPILGVGLGNWKLKSIDYDSKDINGYVVPYHAHSDFIQLGAELGIFGFILYLGIFVWCLIYAFRLIRSAVLSIDEKVFLVFIIVSLGVYSVDANLNFPIARPQVLVVWTLIIALVNIYYQRHKNIIEHIQPNKKLNILFLVLSILIILPSIYVNNLVYKSLKGQMFLLQDFNSNQYNLALNNVDNIVPNIPNITVTTIPINSVKARYYVKAKKYDKALNLINSGTVANPFLYYSEILKSQIFEEKGQLDSAMIYAKKAFFGLPNNDLHSSKYVNLINITRDKAALEEAFELLTYQNKLTNWKNYLVIASNLESKNNPKVIKRANKALELFPNNGDIKRLKSRILIGDEALRISSEFSNKGLEYFNKQDYKNAAIQFENAYNANPLDYAYFENAATANYMIGNFNKANEQIDIVIKKLNPLNGKCEYIKALIYIKMDDPIGACPFLETSRDSGYTEAETLFDQYCRF